MYPELLETQQPKCYYSEKDMFQEVPFHYVHAYIHNDYRFKMHSHGFYEINIIISGSGRHYIENNHLPAHVGDIFVIPPEVRHGYYSENSLDIFHVLLKSDFLMRYNEELMQSPGFDLIFDIEPQVRRSSRRKYNLHVSHDILATLKTELKRIQKAETDQYYVYQNALTLGFISHLGILFNSNFEETKKSLRNTTEILHVMNYIKNNLDSKLTLDLLSSIANMSKATLNRYFQDILQMSPMHYVTECRIIKAKELLKQKKFNKTEIAQICGFFDITHLNKYL